MNRPESHILINGKPANIYFEELEAYRQTTLRHAFFAVVLGGCIFCAGLIVGAFGGVR